MSWSVSFIGKPHAVREELAKTSLTLSGQSKTEYDAALPHMQALVALNEPSAGTTDDAIELIANGHSTLQNDVRTYGSVNVSLKRTSTRIIG